MRQQFDCDRYQHESAAKLDEGNFHQIAGDAGEQEPQDNRAADRIDHRPRPQRRRQGARGEGDQDGVVAAEQQVDGRKFQRSAEKQQRRRRVHRFVPLGARRNGRRLANIAAGDAVRIPPPVALRRRRG